jgi:SM-20-related protein
MSRDDGVRGNTGGWLLAIDQEQAFDTVAAELTAHSWTVMPDFLGSAACAALVAEIKIMAANDTLRTAGVGEGSRRQVQVEVRSDEIHWIDEETSSGPQEAVMHQLEVLRTALNRRLFLGLNELQAHLSVYAPGGSYKKHLDTFRDSSRRVVSCVVYLNPDWSAIHGGELRLYSRTDHSAVARDVAPVGGTLVCFLSAEIAHEVLVTVHDRYSVAGWFSRDAPNNALTRR